MAAVKIPLATGEIEIPFETYVKACAAANYCVSASDADWDRYIDAVTVLEAEMSNGMEVVIAILEHPEIDLPHGCFKVKWRISMLPCYASTIAIPDHLFKHGFRVDANNASFMLGSLFNELEYDYKNDRIDEETDAMVRRITSHLIDCGADICIGKSGSGVVTVPPDWDGEDYDEYGHLIVCECCGWFYPPPLYIMIKVPKIRDLFDSVKAQRLQAENC